MVGLDGMLASMVYGVLGHDVPPFFTTWLASELLEIHCDLGLSSDEQRVSYVSNVRSSHRQLCLVLDHDNLPIGPSDGLRIGDIDLKWMSQMSAGNAVE